MCACWLIFTRWNQGSWKIQRAQRRIVNQLGRFATRCDRKKGRGRRRGRHSGTRRISALTRVSVRFARCARTCVHRTKGLWQVCVEIRSDTWPENVHFCSENAVGTDVERRYVVSRRYVYDAGASCSRWRLFTARWRWNSRRMLETQGISRSCSFEQLSEKVAWVTWSFS